MGEGEKEDESTKIKSTKIKSTKIKSTKIKFRELTCLPVKKGPTSNEEFTCQVCNVTCSDMDCFQAHLAGKKHLKNQKRAAVSNGNMTSNEDFTCQFCNVTCSDEISLQAHLLGRKHRTAISNANARKLPKKKQVVLGRKNRTVRRVLRRKDRDDATISNAEKLLSKQKFLL